MRRASPVDSLAEGLDGAAVDVGLDLVPERDRVAPPPMPQRVERHAPARASARMMSRISRQTPSITARVELGAAVRKRQAEEGGPGVGVPARRGGRGQVGQEEQALGCRAGRRPPRRRAPRRPARPPLPDRQFLGADHVAEPAEGSGGRVGEAFDLPQAGHGVIGDHHAAETRPRAGRRRGSPGRPCPRSRCQCRLESPPMPTTLQF